MKPFLPIAAVVVLMASCTRNPVLREAERLVESQPDSALTLLEGLSRESLSSAREKADYDYLSATAFYRTYFFLDEQHSSALNAAYLFKEQERARTGNLALLLVSVLATLVLYFWARKSQTEKLLLLEKEENERILSAAEDLRARMGAMEKIQGKPKGQSGLDTLDRLCEQYYIYEGTENLQPRILKEVRSIVEGLRNDPAAQKSLEQTLNASAGNVMELLRETFPKWKEEDFLLYLFSASGFSSTTISTLLEKDKPYVYNRLYRLKERIKSSSSEHRALFLASLEK